MTVGEWLIEYQQQHSLTDADMGSLIGITENQWDNIRNGVSSVHGPKTRTGIARAFPELVDQLREELV